MLIPALVLLGGLGLAVLGTLRDKVGALLGLLILTAAISGLPQAEAEEISVLVRRLALLALACLCLKATGPLPTTMRILSLASIVAMAGLVGRASWLGGASLTMGFLLLHWPVARTIASWLRLEGNAQRLGRMFVGVTVVHLAFSLYGLASFDGAARFAGYGVSAPLFAFVGATLLGSLLWGAFYQGGMIRRASLLMIAPVVGVTLLSGQRSSLLVLGAAVLPFLFVGLQRKPSTVVGIATVSVGLVALLGGRLGSLYAFAFGRFASLSDPARQERWAAAWQLIAARPIAGWGPDFRSELGFGVHNSFLAILIELGAIGFLLWLAALGLAGVQIATLLRQPGRSADGLVYLAASWLFVCLAGAMVEDKLYRPTTLPAIVLVLALLLLSTRKGSPQQVAAGARVPSVVRNRSRTLVPTPSPNVALAPPPWRGWLANAEPARPSRPST